jgi:transcriptional regulator with XRE-family HTH domain
MITEFIDRETLEKFDIFGSEFDLCEYGQWIVENRRIQGCSLVDLAKFVNVDKAYISRIENGKVPPSIEVTNNIADVLGLSRFTSYVLSGKLEVDLAKCTDEELELAKYYIDNSIIGF